MQAEPDRFFSKVERFSREECWRWLGATQNGYGVFWVHENNVGAHRYAYECIVGAIPEGLVLDHLCQNKNCVNPSHLEPVTNAENLRRAAARRTHCKHGHEYTRENTLRVRACRACYEAGLPVRIARKKAKRQALREAA